MIELRFVERKVTVGLGYEIEGLPVSERRAERVLQYRTWDAFIDGDLSVYVGKQKTGRVPAWSDWIDVPTEGEA